MGIIKVLGKDNPSYPNPPADNPFVPTPQPKFNPPKAPNGNDSGALWWDRDHPGQPGQQGAAGLKGEMGFDGGPGGNAPQGVTETIDTKITGTFEMRFGGGFGHRTRSKKHMKFIHSTAIIAVATLAFLTGSVRAEDHKIPIIVVVVTTFQSGADNDPTGGEFGNWVLNLPLPITISFPQGYHHLRYNPDLQVLGMETGEFKAHAAASIMGLGMDPRFDLTKAYWIVAGIAGVDPNKASVASTAWAKFVVDGDLAYQMASSNLTGRGRSSSATVMIPRTRIVSAKTMWLPCFRIAKETFGRACT